MKLFIKYMVSAHCKITVKQELEKLGIRCSLIELGSVETIGFIPLEQIGEIRAMLFQSGLELMDDKKSILIERIKNVVIDLVYYSSQPLKINFSNHLSKKLNLDYTYLANIFSEDQGITIERFIILHKIRHVQQLIRYNELNLTEISWKLHYSSVAHLSTQFKKITGITPSYFKLHNHTGLPALENV